MSTTPTTAQRSVGVIVCAGDYPRMVIEGAHRAGMRVVGVGMRGAADRRTAGMCDEYRAFRIGQVEAPLEYLRTHGISEVILAGQIKPACLFTLRPDATARRLLAQLPRRHAHSIFGSACAEAEKYGIRVLPATTFMQDHMPGEGHLAGPAPTPQQEADALFGMGMARRIAELDIGQSIVVHDQRVLCVEGFKGTNECIRSGGGKPYPATLCKVTKPGHDMRFDVPCLGPATIRNCARVNIRHVVFEAGRTILFRRREIEQLCRAEGITLQALPCPPTEPCTLPATENDAAYATELAGCLTRLGIGASAAVCGGVVIAVEDCEGPLKCIRRTAAYMRRMRLQRMLSWLLGIIFRQPAAPRDPIILRTAPGTKLPPQAVRAAERAGIQLG